MNLRLISCIKFTCKSPLFYRGFFLVLKRKLSFDSDSESQLSENRQINNHSVLDHIFDDDYFEVSQQEFMNNNIDCNKKASN